MITPRNSLWLIPLLLIITFPIWKIPVASFLAPRGGYDPKIFDDTNVSHNFTMDKINIQQSEGSMKTADIRAAKALTSKNPNEFVLTKVNADIFNDDGELTNIKAKRGVYNTRTRRLKLDRNVVVTNKEKGFTMKTSQLFYFHHLRKVRCPQRTVFKGDGIVIRGSSFYYDINRGHYEVGGRVVCTIEGYQPL